MDGGWIGAVYVWACRPTMRRALGAAGACRQRALAGESEWEGAGGLGGDAAVAGLAIRNLRASPPPPHPPQASDSSANPLSALKDDAAAVVDKVRCGLGGGGARRGARASNPAQTTPRGPRPAPGRGTTVRAPRSNHLTFLVARSNKALPPNKQPSSLS